MGGRRPRHWRADRQQARPDRPAAPRDARRAAPRRRRARDAARRHDGGGRRRRARAVGPARAAGGAEALRRPVGGSLGAPGGHQDFAPVHLLTTRTLAHLRALHPDIAWDVRRFRRTSSSTTATGPARSPRTTSSDGRYGTGGLRITVGLPTPRCVVPTRATRSFRPTRGSAPARRRPPDRARALRTQPCAGAPPRSTRPPLAVGEVLTVSARGRPPRTTHCARPSAASRPGSRRDRAAARPRRRRRLRGRRRGYAEHRRPDPRIAARVHAALGAARTWSTSARARGPTSLGTATSCRSSPPPRCARSGPAASRPPSTRRPSGCRSTTARSTPRWPP